MRVPQVKEAPSQALRAVFAGIGQMLHITDKLRSKSAASPNPETIVPAAAAPQTATRTPAPAAAAPETIPSETASAETATAETAAAESAGGHVRLIESDAAPAAAADPVPAAAADPAPSAELPLANYDNLTIASLRARLRNLSADQLGQLIDYEKGHAGRADVITMFERRIAKLAEG